MSSQVTNSKCVLYCRVSTTKQEESGLGLESQRTATRAFAASKGWKVVGEFEDVESGAVDVRVGLEKALGLARRHRCPIVVKSLDRLGRNTGRLLQLVEQFDVFLVDCPDAGPLEIRLRAIIAAEERDAISRRTTAALAALRSRGVALGSAREGHWEGREQQRLDGLTKARAARQALVEARREEIHEDIRNVLVELGDKASLRAISARLNEHNIPTPRGCSWCAASVRRELLRMGDFDAA